jgi:CDGSH-type Zn-finger protein
MSDVTIQAMDNGPLKVSGPITLLDGAGTARTVDREIVALCRCGASKNKPFCDASHKTLGFTADERA